MNETFFTVAVFTYPTEVIVPRITLETAGIECITRDEETITTNPMLSNAVGGIKLQVGIEDYERAVSILKDAGVQIYTDDGASLLQKKIDVLTSKMPIIGKFHLHYRLVLAMITIVLLLVIVAGLLAGWINRPNIEEGMTRGAFQLESVEYIPDTSLGESNIIISTKGTEQGAKRPWGGGSWFRIDIRENNTFVITGYCEKSIHGDWDLRGSKLEFLDCDTLSDIFEGEFEIELEDYKLKIQNETTTIMCTSNYERWR